VLWFAVIPPVVPGFSEEEVVRISNPAFLRQSRKFLVGQDRLLPGWPLKGNPEHLNTRPIPL
jgi:hypothetical protein